MVFYSLAVQVRLKTVTSNRTLTCEDQDASSSQHCAATGKAEKISSITYRLRHTELRRATTGYSQFTKDNFMHYS